jgi:hypothetical protein
MKRRGGEKEPEGAGYCRRGASLLLLIVTACRPIDPGDCGVPRRTAVLPDELREASGVVASVRNPGLFWAHNDSRWDPVLTLVDTSGTIHARVRIDGAANVDWEDIAIGRCDDGHCIYIADTGDNRFERGGGVIYRLPEPDRSDSVASAEAFPVRYPDGSYNVEALFVLDDETIYLISKGTLGAPVVFRHAGTLRRGEELGMQRVQSLGSKRPLRRPDRVTGADATGDGSAVLLRSSNALRFYRLDGDTLVAFGRLIDLRPLGEGLGEGVTLGPDRLVVLVGERVPSRDVPATISVVECGG